MSETKADGPSGPEKSPGTAKHEDREMVGKVWRIVSNLKRAQEGINTTEQELQQAENSHRTIQRKYTNGSGTPNEVKASLQRLTKANLANNQAKYDFQIALIGLEEILSLDIGNLTKDFDLPDLLKR